MVNEKLSRMEEENSMHPSLRSFAVCADTPSRFTWRWRKQPRPLAVSVQDPARLALRSD
jgi:hypothetical protein